MIANVVQHHNRKQFKLTVWSEYKGRPEQSQFNNDVSNMQWMITEVIHNTNNVFLARKLQYIITIRAVSDLSYHPTYQYGTSAWIIKIQNNDRAITGANVVPGYVKS